MRYCDICNEKKSNLQGYTDADSNLHYDVCNDCRNKIVEKYLEEHKPEETYLIPGEIKND